MSDAKAMLITVCTSDDTDRSAFLKEAEIRSLINTLGIQVACHISFSIKSENPVSYIGKGQAENALEYSRAFDVDEVIINAFLSPRQERYLENLFQLPVSDREAVILSIFYSNAHSIEARLQIEKAEAIYLKPRLAGREANLSQQRGGVRGAKGEGERKIELERRRIDSRIKALEKEIEKIKRKRETQRKARSQNGIFTFALAGYTNAGKSTLLNRLTDSDVLAEDKLFATLDTTTRSLKLPNGQKVLLSDTVGFISDLPHTLIEAFSSTLEEALNADAIIIVADASHPDSIGCFRTALSVLEELGARSKVRLIAINKIDQASDDISLAYLRSQGIETAGISARDGFGIDGLLGKMTAITDDSFADETFIFPISSPLRSSLYNDASIRGEEYTESDVIIKARIRKELIGKYKKGPSDEEKPFTCHRP
ncbi:MAG: GTPase HflX [Candidatus Ornithospirochaeta sp.]|nr:GTPase HflX [Candidatus Ornithospirochaeta sp.]